MIYLLDTNILIAYVRGENAIRNFVDENYAPLSVGNEAVISVVSANDFEMPVFSKYLNNCVESS